MKKRITLIYIFALSITLFACSVGNNQSSQSEQQLLTGYLALDGDVLKVDEFEYITLQDKEKMKTFGLSAADMPNGYSIVNESEDVRSFTLDQNTHYTFYDTSNLFVKEEEDKKYSTTDLDKFRTFLYRDNDTPIKIPFEIIVQDEKVISITEIFVN